MHQWAQLVLTAFVAIMASSGFWTWLARKDTSKTSTQRLLMGLAYDKITHLGMKYIERGWISKDEYEDFRKYFYEPYKAFGGNGVAERVIQAVDELPFKSFNKYLDKAAEAGLANQKENT